MTRKRHFFSIHHSALVLAGLSVLLVATLSAGAAQIGSPAPDFHGTDSNGKTQSLDEYRGKYVVLAVDR